MQDEYESNDDTIEEKDAFEKLYYAHNDLDRVVVHMNVMSFAI